MSDFAHVVRLLLLPDLLPADMALPHLLQSRHSQEKLHLRQAYRAVKHHDLCVTMSISQLEWCFKDITLSRPGQTLATVMLE